jgi:hypothetical protein
VALSFAMYASRQIHCFPFSLRAESMSPYDSTTLTKYRPLDRLLLTKSAQMWVIASVSLFGGTSHFTGLVYLKV